MDCPLLLGAELNQGTKLIQYKNIDMKNIKIDTRLNKDPFLIGELKASLADILILCSKLERGLKREIERMSGEKFSGKVIGLSQQIDHWRGLHQEAAKEILAHKALLDTLLTELADIVDIRNRICHGQTGLSGSDSRVGLDAFIVTELNGSERKITLTELKLAAQRLNRINSHLGGFSLVAREKNFAKFGYLYTELQKGFMLG